MNPKVTFKDKVDFINDISVPDENKITAANINEMKEAINEGSSSISVGPDLETAEKKALFIQTITQAQAIAETRGITVNEYDARLPMSQVRINDEVGSQGLDEYIDKNIVKSPIGKVYNDFGTIFLEALDLNNLKETIVNGYVMDGINLPINHNGYLNIQALSATYCVQTFSSVTEDCVFQRKLVDGVWRGWKLIAGEVLLWSGSVTNAFSVVDLICDISMFGNIVMYTDGKWNLVAEMTGLPIFISGATAYNSGNKSVVISQAIFERVSGTNKQLKLNAEVGYYITPIGSGATTFNKQSILKLIGRP